MYEEEFEKLQLDDFEDDIDLNYVDDEEDEYADFYEDFDDD